MRAIIIICLSFLLVVPALADDGANPFSEMTITELVAVDTKVLSKADKKLHRNALRAAKKAEKARKSVEKKRIVAEKKAKRARVRAEKKRAKTEAKRLRAETKARAKKNKKNLKRLAVIQEIYEETSVSKDDFEAHFEIVSSRYPNPFSIFKIREDTDFRFRAFYFPDEQKLTIRLRVSREVGTTELNSESVKYINVSPETFATRNGIWRNYSRATVRGGKLLTVHRLSRYYAGCDPLSCKFREDIGIELDYELLANSVRNHENLEIKISGKYYFIATVPLEFIAGYLKKMAENVDIDGKYAALAQQVEIGLKEQLVTAPTSVPD